MKKREIVCQSSLVFTHPAREDTKSESRDELVIIKGLQGKEERKRVRR